MPVYDFLEYSDHYSMAAGCLWNFNRDEINDNENDANKNMVNNTEITASNSLKVYHKNNREHIKLFFH